MRNKIILPLALAAAALLLLVIAGVSAQGTLLPTARGGSLASHQDGRGASVARRDDREYREYLREEQRRQRGGIAGLPKEELGKQLFFDTNLSTPPGLACAGCHGPEVGYTGPDAAINAAGAVYEGAVAGRFGNRKPPSAAYAGDSPILHFDGTTWVGGMFWDGRATGLTLGDPLAEQAQGPFLNPLEQNNASSQVVINKVLASSYSDLFSEVVTGITPAEQYDGIGRAIAAY